MISHATPDATLRIGALASRTGITVEALRYYEKRGLLRPASRRATGYREYAADSVRLVRFIKRAQALGFSLAEVEELVRLRERAWAGDAPRMLREAAVAKVEDIDRRLQQLRALRDALAQLVSACDAACPLEPSSSPIEERRGPKATSLPCPLIEAFDADAEESGRDAPSERTASKRPRATGTHSPPSLRRRASATRRLPGRGTSPTQRRNQ